MTRTDCQRDHLMGVRVCTLQSTWRFQAVRAAHEATCHHLVELLPPGRQTAQRSVSISGLVSISIPWNFFICLPFLIGSLHIKVMYMCDMFKRCPRTQVKHRPTPFQHISFDLHISCFLKILLFQVASQLVGLFRHRAGSVPTRPPIFERRRHRTQSEGEKDATQDP